MMLAQLLQKHELGARVVPHQAASRTGIETLDATGVAVVCLSYLELSGNPASLRYLLRRLRQRLPEAKLLVGIWPVGDDFLNDEEMRDHIGADFYVSSLTDAIETCLKVSQQAVEDEADGELAHAPQPQAEVTREPEPA